MDKSIMPECYADTLLIETLIPTKSGYNHKHNCFKVEAEMKFGKFQDSFAVGIIDNDKKAIGYLNEFEKLDEINGSLILWKHKQKHHFIIQICPALERWVLDICIESDIKVEDFGLQNDLEGLKKRTKSMSSLKDADLKNLFSVIKENSEHESVRKLTGWVSLLKEKNYSVDLNDLKNV